MSTLLKEANDAIYRGEVYVADLFSPVTTPLNNTLGSLLAVPEALAGGLAAGAKSGSTILKWLPWLFLALAAFLVFFFLKNPSVLGSLAKGFAL